ncbi:uncharacterized protein VP01_148g15 [Puccinia sorghi]|uniref:Uncharacterized protein n=1 Tax=Puccinia sorghi TaxID=27349 RepID=A0A0L6VJF1_9BASI|nr:uncharacterized protein VP01_148g15 [Puccinia sorghi]
MNLDVTLGLEDESTSNEETDEDYDENLKALNNIEDKARALVAIQLQCYIRQLRRPPLSVTIYCTHLKIKASRERFECLMNTQRANDDNLEEIWLLWKWCFRWNVSHFFCLAEGTVELYTNRCIMAIVALKDRYDMWPTEEEHLEVQAEFEEVGFKGYTTPNAKAPMEFLPFRYAYIKLCHCSITPRLLLSWPVLIGTDSAFSPTINFFSILNNNRNSIKVVVENCIVLSDQRDLNRITAWINVCVFSISISDQMNSDVEFDKINNLVNASFLQAPSMTSVFTSLNTVFHFTLNPLCYYPGDS